MRAITKCNSYWFLEHPSGDIDSELFANGPIKIHVERPDLVEPQMRPTGEKIDYNRQVNDKTVSVEMEIYIYKISVILFNKSHIIF